MAQFYLAKLISDHWVEIRSHLRKSQYSAEIPEIEDDKARAIAQPDFTLLALKKIEISAAFDHTLVSDISRFYGTLYTHSIAWALHGKIWCKQNMHKPAFNTSLGNKLDIAVRKGQENQTLGIPIGPDTSRILSEILGSAIDGYVQQELDLDRTRAFRNVDDWYIGFESLGQAEDAISTIARGCQIFGLELNSEKTKASHASSTADSVWATELREYRLRVNSKGQSRSLEHYFLKSFEFSLSNPDQNVMDYAIKRTKGFRIRQENWHLYESFLLKAARSNATVIPTVVQIFINYNFAGYTLGKSRISSLIENIISKNSSLGHHAEVSWALFMAKGLRITISPKAAELISKIENSVVALIALDLRDIGLIASGGLDTTLWEFSMTGQGLKTHMWLLAYEAGLKGWLTGTPSTFIDDDPFFGVLKQKRISFYDVRRNIPNIERERPRRPSPALLEFLRESQINPPPEIFGLSLSGYL